MTSHEVSYKHSSSGVGSIYLISGVNFTMPTIAVERDHLFRSIGKVFSKSRSNLRRLRVVLRGAIFYVWTVVYVRTIMKGGVM